jgi:hypothetical protein
MSHEPISTLQMGASLQTDGEAPQGPSQAAARTEPLLLCWNPPVKIEEVRPEKKGWNLQITFSDRCWCVLQSDGVVSFSGFEAMLEEEGLDLNVYRRLVDAWKRKRNWKPSR